MKKILRTRNVVLAVIVFVLVGTAQFVYRTNNFCEPGDHPIRSEEDAIAVAKKKMVKNPFFSSERFGSAPDFVAALERAENCCNAIRHRNILTFILAQAFQPLLLACIGGHREVRRAIPPLSQCRTAARFPLLIPTKMQTTKGQCHVWK
jgi:hypothetical protein